MGLVSSFHQPAGNVTGFYFLLTGLVAKRLALLHELLPGGKRVAVLVNPTNMATAEPTKRDTAVASRALGLDIHLVFNASTSGEIERGVRGFLGLAGPKPCSSVLIRSSSPRARGSWPWRRPMRFPCPTSRAVMSKPAA